MEAKLKKFVEEQYEKVKRAKKSPKNFGIFKENGYFGIGKEEVRNTAKETYEGNLYQLYTSRFIKDINVIKVKDERKILYSSRWTHPIKLILKAADFDKMTYNGNIAGVSKKDFKSIQNWVKSN